MGTVGQVLQLVADGAAAVGAEVVAEIVVQDVAAGLVAVDSQFQVVAQAVAGCVDAVVVANCGQQQRFAPHLAAVGEVHAVQGHKHFGSHGVGLGAFGRTVQVEAVVVAVAFERMVVAHGINVDAPGGVAVTDVVGHGNLHAEAPSPDGVAPFEERVAAVGICHGPGVGAFVVLARHGGFAVEERERCHARKTGQLLARRREHAAAHPHLAAGAQLHVAAVGEPDAPDAVDDGLPRGEAQPQRGVAKEVVFQLVVRAVASVVDELDFGQLQGFAHGVVVACLVRFEQMLAKGHVQPPVGVGIDLTRGTHHGNGASVLVEQGGPPDVVASAVERGHLARGKDPKRDAGRGNRAEIVRQQQAGVRYAVGGAVSAVIEHQGAAAHLLFQLVRHLRVGVARGCYRALVDVPEETFHNELAVGRCLHLVVGSVGVFHVVVVVDVVAHEANGVSPRAHRRLFHVGNGFVDDDARLLGRAAREAADAQVDGLNEYVAALAVVEQAVVVVGDVAVQRADGVLLVGRFVGQQKVVGRERGVFGHEHAVVPQAFAEEQQVARRVGVGRGAVVEHFQVAAIGGGVGRARGKFVVYLVGRHHLDTQIVALAVLVGQPFGLFREQPGGRHDDNHVEPGVGMQVLVGRFAHQFGGGAALLHVDNGIAPVAVGHRCGEDAVGERRGHFGHGVARAAQPPQARRSRCAGDAERDGPPRAWREREGPVRGVEAPGVVDADEVEPGGVAGCGGEAERVAGCRGRRVEARAHLACVFVAPEAGHRERAQRGAVERDFGPRRGERVRGRKGHPHRGVLAFDDAGSVQREAVGVAVGEIVGIVKLAAARVPAVSVVVEQNGIGHLRNGGRRRFVGRFERGERGRRLVGLGQEVVGVG